MIKRKYYDGPLVDDGRTIEEIEKDIQQEEEICENLKEWPPIE